MQVRTRTWFGFVVLASLLFLAGSRFAMFDPLENAATGVTSPIDSFLRDVTRPVADFINNATDINRLSNENRDLQEENEALTAEVVRLRESERELQQLRGLIDLRGVKETDSFLAANVFASEPNNSQRIVAIDRGSGDGVREDMLVLSPQGSVIGVITRVLGGSSWVTLLTDQTSAVSAFVQESRVQGVVVGNADGTLTMEFVEDTADIKNGDTVLTSGAGGQYPSGELIGQVVDVQQSPQDLFQEVHIEPLADFSRLENVLILTSFVAPDPVAP